LGSNTCLLLSFNLIANYVINLINKFFGDFHSTHPTSTHRQQHYRNNRLHALALSNLDPFVKNEAGSIFCYIVTGWLLEKKMPMNISISRNSTTDIDLIIKMEQYI
jgi:hypothetical protein